MAQLAIERWNNKPIFSKWECLILYVQAGSLNLGNFLLSQCLIQGNGTGERVGLS